MTSYTHHKDYKTCNSCGANLDHGEKCDCEDHSKSCCCEGRGEPCCCVKERFIVGALNNRT